jgi:hypothetical protein
MRKFKHKKFGDIATSNGDGTYTMMDFNYVHSKYIENSSDWEEVVEKEWIVLEYNDEFIPFRNSAIKSVKRISDGEIFTIGDKLSDEDGKIIGFNIDEKFAGGLTVTYKGGQTSILYAEKDKTPPLFLTTDGEFIYEGDTYYYISEWGWKINTMTEASKRKIDQNSKTKRFKHFCAAQNFVNENKIN